MTDRNPYENGDGVDIPNFGSIREDDQDSRKERSLFRAEEEEDDGYYDDEYDDEPEYRRVKKPAIIATAVIMALLLALAIGGFAWGLARKKAYDTLKADYDKFVTKATSTESPLNARITELEKQIADLTKGPETGTADGEAVYQVAVTDGLAVRTGASANKSFADYDALPDDIKALCEANDGYVYINYGSNVTVYETVTENYSEGTRIWGRIADNAWICLKTNNDDYCVKQ